MGQNITHLKKVKRRSKYQKRRKLRAKEERLANAKKRA